MVKIIAFEGADYSGKSSTMLNLAKRYSKVDGFAFNEGPVYPTELTARLLCVANQSNGADIEYLYSMIFALDKAEQAKKHMNDDRIVFNDRYWASVVAYGRFKNPGSSIHSNPDFQKLFIPPVATIHFSCSYDEKVRRSQIRGRKSVIDAFLLSNPSELKRLEAEIETSLEGLPHVYRVDTTGKSIDQVADFVDERVHQLRTEGIL